MHTASQPRGLPTGAYQVEVVVKAFELRYLRQASTCIRDIMMITCSPKSRAVLPTDERTPKPVNLFIPTHITRSVNINWKKSRFTLIKGPHIDKRGMEQFEARRYKAVIRTSTNSAEEVQWLLDHLKLYEFTGVQLHCSVTAATYLTPAQLDASTTPSPPASPPQLGRRPPLLTSHRQHITPFLLPAAKSSLDHYSADLHAGLRATKDAVHAGLQHRRQALQEQPWYQTWHTRNKLAALSQNQADPDTPPRSTSAPASYQALVGQRLQAQAGDDKEAAAPSLARRTSAFLAAMDAVLLDLRLDVLETHRNFPMHFCTGLPPPPTAAADAAAVAPGSSVSSVDENVRLAQWMHAVLKSGQYVETRVRLSQEKELLDAYTQYNLLAHSVQFTLLKQWVEAAGAGAKAFLALPTREEQERLGGGGGGREGGKAGAGRETGSGAKQGA